MAKIKLHIDPPKVDKSTIEKYKNYNAFRKGYLRYYSIYSLRRLYRNQKWRNLIVLIATIILALFLWD